MSDPKRWDDWLDGADVAEPVHEGHYAVHWSAEDCEYVATHSGYPSLSWLEVDAQDALAGIIRLVASIEDERTHG